jgi:hypothetical protein
MEKQSMEEDSDLSEYEKRRLANIKRNNAMLLSLGLGEKIGVLSAKKLKAPDNQKLGGEKVKKREPSQRLVLPVRSSKRLRGAAKPNYVEEKIVGNSGLLNSSPSGSDDDEAGENDTTIDYSTIPHGPEYLGAAQININ